MSLNVNGIRGYGKCIKLFSKYVYKESLYPKPDVICLQETHISPDIEQRILNITNLDMCFANFRCDAGGLIVGFRRSLDYTVFNYEAFTEGNSHILVVDCIIKGQQCVIVNCYFHAWDTVAKVCSLLVEILRPYLDRQVILCGDFNAVMDLDLDTAVPACRSISYKSRNRQLKDFVEHAGLWDSWRVFNPNTKRYTHFRTQTKGARIDHIFVNEALVNSMYDAQIGIAYETDHCPVYLTITTGRNPPGKGYWKFPSFLVKDPEFKIFLKEQIAETIELNPDTPPGLLWDTVKCQIRTSSMMYMKTKNKERRQRIELIESTIAELDHLRNTADTDKDVEIVQDLNDLKENLTSHYLDRGKGFATGKKEAEDERSTKYFFHRPIIPGSTNMLYNEIGEEVSNDRDILKICNQFYDKLYADPQPSETPYYDFIPPDDYHRKLTQQQADILDQEITKEELYTTLKNMKIGKAPGIDGMTVEFYMEFWEIIGDLLFKSIDYAQKAGHFSISQRRGVIKLIPKKNKNPHFVKNLRPITLLNIDYKILTKLLANRLRQIMDEIVREDQNAFIKRRYIGTNILDLYSLIAAADENEDEAAIILLDIEKAFDTINWKFLKKTLIQCGFPQRFVHWIDIMQVEKELRIFNNGHSSDPIYPLRGVAQGCALSPLIFILAMEMLANVVRNTDDIVGIKAKDRHKKIELAADDTLIAMQATPQCFSELNKILDSFAIQSGLRVNFSKSNVVRIGKNKDHPPLLNFLQFEWLKQDEYFTYLGLKLRIQGEFASANFVDHHKLVSQATAGMRYAYRGLIGRILIVKSLVASKFVYRFNLLPTPPPVFFKRMDKTYYDYVWDDGRHRISKKIMEQPMENGGFNMLNVKYQENSLKLIWIQRLLADSASKYFWQEHISSCFCVPLTDLIRFNLHPSRMKRLINRKSILPPFWNDVFYTYFSWTYVSAKKLSTCEYVGSLSICFNSAFGNYRVAFMLKQYRTFKDVDIFTIHEFLNSELSPRRKIAIDWYDMFNSLPIEILGKKYDQSHAFIRLYEGNTTVKGIVSLFRELNSCQNEKAIAKWSRDLDFDVQPEWSQYCLKSKLLENMKLRAFHLQYLNRGYQLNVIKAKYSDIDPECSLCKKEPETYLHLFWQCEETKAIWDKLIDILEMIADPTENDINMQNCLLSNYKTKLLVLLTVYFKRYIFYSTFMSYTPHWKHFTEFVIKLRERHYSKCKYQKKIQQHFQFWGILVNDNVFN